MSAIWFGWLKRRRWERVCEGQTLDEVAKLLSGIDKARRYESVILGPNRLAGFTRPGRRSEQGCARSSSK